MDKDIKELALKVDKQFAPKSIRGSQEACYFTSPDFCRATGFVFLTVGNTFL